MLGLGLVVAVMAILLLGTVYGLLSYRLSSNTMESKVGELAKAQEFKEAIVELARSKPALIPSPDDRGSDDRYKAEQGILRQQVDAALKALNDYRGQFHDTVDRGRFLKPDLHTDGFLDAGFREDLIKRLDAVEAPGFFVHSIRSQ